MFDKKVRTAIFLLIFAAAGIFFWISNYQVTASKEEEPVFVTTRSAGQTASGMRVWLEAPATVEAGQRFSVRLMADGVENLGGFETVLQFDPAQLALLTAAANPGLMGPGREQLEMGYVQREDSILLAAAGCPVADCKTAAYETAHAEPGVSGRLELATFTFAVRNSGKTEIALAEYLLVDTAGHSLLGSSRYENDRAGNAAPPLATLDLTGNQVINQSDAYLVVSAWRELGKTGLCLQENISFYDVNGSGCLSVADVQTILSRWGKNTGQTPGEPGVSSPRSSFVVDSDKDNSDSNLGDGLCRTNSGDCTLRAAIEEANVLPGADTIAFDIRQNNGSCPALVTIQPSSGLLVDAADNASLTIDGYSQCDASPNSGWVNGNAVIKIEVEGNNDNSEYGLHILTPRNTVKGLSLYNWHRQIQLFGTNAYSNTIQGNFLGTNAANDFTQVAPGLEGEGIRIELGAHNNLIGGTTAAARNIVSGNDQDGVGLQGSGADYNVIINNFIGLSQNGSSRLRNDADGVDVAEGVANNQIGGLGPGERNIISGNNRDGVEISHDLNTQHNHLVGNFIGLNPAGNGTIANGGRGVTFEDNVTNNQVYRNIIVSSGGDGARFYTVFDNDLYDNFIGVAPTGLGPLDVVPVPGSENGLIPLPNGTKPQAGIGLSGVFMVGGSQGNSVTHNIIAHHPEYGIYLNADAGYLPNGTCEVYYNTFSQNSLYENAAQGIRLRSDSCDGSTYYPNEGIGPPLITAATMAQITGTTCPGCLVEIFVADKAVETDPDGDNWGEGKTYLAQGTADSGGSFTVSLTGVLSGTILTAHATDGAGNTSEFARNVAAALAPPAIDTPNITLSNSDIILNWNHYTQNFTYEVWRSQDPYFSPGGPGSIKLADLAGPTVIFTDTTVLTNSDGSFYRIKAVNPVGTAVSDQVGFFKYFITTIMAKIEPS